MAMLDEIDRRIVKCLRLDARITNNALAEAVGLSPSACLRRIRILERSGVIQGYTAIISGVGPGEGMSAIVQIELERQTEEYLARFENALRMHPEIQEWYLMTGDGDYLLRVQIAGIDDYGQFHRDVLSRLPGVSRITSSFAMRSHRGR
ncbi:Lrp/AsnC family transcriptional regulator [Tsuneonella flava]|uniref:Lrp/AsnC family transcriptional regulator n=1 Tax=Tsuneonella flava TaxID=2055955 RepID=A0ABX7KBW2_9SPHN|nr:Lrp/AsnC family transcriptional regulator [Tsuneonella flava]QSB44684.1 Lrp/AsnC family transcriptional regulator [Tsuneonella flava]